MKTEIKISAIAYDLEIVDLRTHTKQADRIVLDKTWLDVLNKVDMSYEDFIRMTYNKQGYYVLQIQSRKKIALTVDLEELYQKQVQLDQLQTFEKVHTGEQEESIESKSCDE